jgi:hypothetical protein
MSWLAPSVRPCSGTTSRHPPLGVGHWASGQMFTEQECRRLSPILVPVSQRRQVIGPRIVELTTKQGAPRVVSACSRMAEPA